MGMRLSVGMVGMILSTFLALPPVHAADEDATAEAAPVETENVSHEQILQEIEATRETDPELAAEMEHQLELWESGELDLTAGREMAFEASAGATGGTPGQFVAPELLGPPVDGTTGMPSYMTPELRDQLFQVYDGVANGQVSEQEARAKAEGIMREHGIDPREMGPGHEGAEQREGFERAWEQMAPEAREQMEKFFQDREGVETMREMSERGFEAPMREYEAATPEFEAATHEYEAATREFEAPMREYEAATREYEAPTHEYEAPTREYEAATREYEAPTHEYEAPEAPQHDYEAPEAPTREYEAPQYEAPQQP